VKPNESPENSAGFLSRAAAVVVAFASVVGSGVIVLPAAVLAESGSAAVLVWIATALLCIPMIMLFRDTVLHGDGDPDPLRSSVRRGLGPAAGRMVPVCFSLVVVVGLPTSAVAGAHFLGTVIPLPVPPAAVAAILLGIAAITNLAGGRTSARLQGWVAGILVVVLVAAALGAISHPVRSPHLVPEAAGLGVVPSGMLIAFWAFVGFENLTFVARDMRNPRRDFGFVAAVALGLLVSLAVLLTVAIARQMDTVDPLTGVVDALRVGRPGPTIAAVVAAVGAAGVLLNALAWVRGCALVLDAAAGEGIFPTRLATPGQTPRRAICALTLGFVATLGVLARWPEAVVDLMAAASAVFVIIYVLCILAHLRQHPPIAWAVANALVLPVMITMLIGSGWRSVYGLVVLVLAALISGPIFRRRASDRSPAPPGTDGHASVSCPPLAAPPLRVTQGRTYRGGAAREPSGPSWPVDAGMAG